MYEYVTHLKTISVDMGLDTIINEDVNVTRRSIKWLPLFFYEPWVADERDSVKAFNLDITEVKGIVTGIPNKVYSQGMEGRDMWEEIFRRFGKENSAKNATDFYAGNRFALFIDLRSMKDMEANWDWWIQKKFSSQLTGNYRVQELLNVISSSSRMLSSTLLTVSWKAWLINEITSNLQRQNFDRRTNQGTRQYFCEKIQHWYLKIFTLTINTLPITRWRDKRIIRDYNIHILFRTHEWDIVNYYSPMKNSSFLEIKVVPKMCKNCFWNPSWFQGWLEVKVKNVMNCLKMRAVFKMRQNAPFLTTPPPPPPRPPF